MALADNWNYDIDYQELRETGSANFGNDSGSATRVFLVDWSNHLAFIDDLRGYSYTEVIDNHNDPDLENPTAYRKIRRVLPDPHPIYDQYYCTDVSVEGYGAPNFDAPNYPTFPKAKVTAVYTSVPYAVLSDSEINVSGMKDLGNYPGEIKRFVVREFGFQSDYLTKPGNTMAFVRSGIAGDFEKKHLESQPGVVLPAQELIYTWRGVPSIPSSPFHPPILQAINTCLGKVNSKPFDRRLSEGGDTTINDSGYQPGTLLFVGVEVQLDKRRLNTQNQTMWNITYKFILRDFDEVVFSADNPHGQEIKERAGHNFLFNTEFNQWDVVTVDGIYRYRNDGNETWTGTYSVTDALAHPNVNDPRSIFRIYREADFDNLFRLDV